MKQFYPLIENPFSKRDIEMAIKTLKSKNLTMGKETKRFEKFFSKKIGSKYALMLNSGSSANLLALKCLTNPLKKNHIKAGSECLVPALCWSTTFWPIIQSNLVPKFIDVNLKNFSIDLENIKKNLTKKTKAIFLINVLGNCSEIDKIKDFCKKKKIYLIEDNCESLGTKFKNKYLGTFGNFGTFSFYCSHQISSGEGGMIVTNNYKDYKILSALRAHGWDRNINEKNRNNFNFINEGFNLRPLEVSATIGLNQFKRLNKLIKIRSQNRNKIINKLKTSRLWKNQFDFFYCSKNVKPSWFGLPLLINNKFIKKKKSYLRYLKSINIETRPIISGNFTNQKCISNYKLKFKNNNLQVTNQIDKRGFFIGIPNKPINDRMLKYLSYGLLNFLDEKN